jgi:hypothetical protein
MELGYSAAPNAVIIRILSYLVPYPDRMHAALACVRWKECSADSSLLKWVLPIERCRDRDGNAPATAADASKPGNHGHSNTFTSLQLALRHCECGDTIMLPAGHYWESELTFTKPVRVLGETDDPARVIIELKAADTRGEAHHGHSHSHGHSHGHSHHSHSSKHHNGNASAHDGAGHLSSIVVKSSARAVQFSGLSIQRQQFHGKTANAISSCPLLKCTNSTVWVSTALNIVGYSEFVA